MLQPSGGVEPFHPAVAFHPAVRPTVMPTTTDAPFEKSYSSTSTGLLHQWVLAGIASAAARFIPVPFVDDMVRDRARQYVVSKTLAAHQTAWTTDDLEALYGGKSRGLIGGTVNKLVRLPLKLAFYPIRKFVKIAGSIRGVPMDVMKTVLIGRTLDRLLAEDRLPTPGPDRDARAEQAKRLTSAFNEAFKGMDFIAVSAAIRDTIDSASEWKAASAEAAAAVFGGDKPMPQTLTGEITVKATAEKVEETLEQPETKALLTTFDQRFDAAYA